MAWLYQRAENCSLVKPGLDLMRAWLYGILGFLKEHVKVRNESSITHPKTGERGGLEKVVLAFSCGQVGVRSVSRLRCGCFEIEVAN